MISEHIEQHQTLCLPWSCTYRMMLPRTPYSDTVQGSLSWAWMLSDLRNILQSAEGTRRRCWLLPAGRGRPESPRELRKSRSWLFISSTCERAHTPRRDAAKSTRGVICGLILRLDSAQFCSSPLTLLPESAGCLF